MSRREFTSDKWLIAVGFDRYTNSFIQVWEQPYEDQEMPILVIDGLGVRATGLDRLDKDTTGLVHEISDRFRYAREKGIDKPNIDIDTICRIAHSLGFKEDIDQEIAELLD